MIQEERFAEAIEPLSQAVKLDPFLATAFNARGYAYFRLKKLPQAIADFDQAIKLNPVYANAYTNRSGAKRAAGDKTGADADQAKARDLLKAAAKCAAVTEVGHASNRFQTGSELVTELRSPLLHDCGGLAGELQHPAGEDAEEQGAERGQDQRDAQPGDRGSAPSAASPGSCMYITTRMRR